MKLAAALVQIGGLPHEDVKQMTADQIISIFELDHWPVPVAHDGPDEPWNLTWRLRSEHRAKTANGDAPMIAKVRRLTREQEELRRVLLKPTGHKRRRNQRWPSRPMMRRAKRC